MNKTKYDKYKDSTMMTCFYVSLAANWYWVAAAVLAFVANRLWGLSPLVPLALLIVWVVSAMISASMIKHASENPLPTEEMANVNPYSKASQDYVKVEKEAEKQVDEVVSEAKSAGTELLDEVQEVDIADAALDVKEEITSEPVKSHEEYGLFVEGQTELDKALKFDVEEEVEKVPELVPNGDIKE